LQTCFLTTFAGQTINNQQSKLWNINITTYYPNDLLTFILLSLRIVTFLVLTQPQASTNQFLWNGHKKERITTITGARTHTSNVARWQCSDERGGRNDELSQSFVTRGSREVPLSPARTCTCASALLHSQSLPLLD